MDFIEEQIKSILLQITHEDELIIVDDASTDGTFNYLCSLNDKRIKLFLNEKNIGHVKSFSKCIKLAKAKYLLFADQDDIWVDGRLDAFKKKLNCGAYLVSSNFSFIDQNGTKIDDLNCRLISPSEGHYFKNIFYIFAGRSSYHGCTMAINRKLISIIYPIPFYVESHDLWIAIGANLLKNVMHIDSNTLLRRIHGRNVSVINRSFVKKIYSRLIFLISITHLLLRIFKNVKTVFVD